LGEVINMGLVLIIVLGLFALHIANGCHRY
jgi:hypothetical protein